MPETNDKKTVVIFAGAGASKAVSPDNYPTTVEFFERLPETVTKNSLFAALVGFLYSTKGKGAKIDIEEVLWHLQDLQKFLQDMSNENTIAGWFASQDRLSKAIGLTGQNFGHFREIAAQGNPRIDGLIGLIDQRVYDFYVREPLEDELAQTWKPLLLPLYRAGYRIELATTNYDVVLENAVEAIAAPDKVHLITGRRGTINPWLDMALWEDPDSIRYEHGLLTKLHGSVDWQRGNGRIHTGTPLFSGQHENHMIIYPGFKGQPDQPEFQAFHRHFGRTLEIASAVVFLGFAFRDEYIDQICRSQLNDGAEIVVCNPDADLAVPFPEHRVKRVTESFDVHSAASVGSLLVDF